VVILSLPLAQGTFSTTTRLHVAQSIRRMAYRKKTTMPHSGTNWNLRCSCVS